MSSCVIAPYALLPGGWAADVRIVIDADGTIASITPASPRGDATLLNGPVIPGMPNVHSHAFQRAFAGRAERRITGDDSFWTWRQAMYGLASRVRPDDLEAIAAHVYVEMLEAGYTAAGEFHYIHHDVGGRRYSRRSEMGQRLLAAADEAGIGITLLPAFYRWSGFGKTPPLDEQSRFVTDLGGVGLGDGIFPLAAWLAAGGAVAIGSDSHVSIDVAEELRWLEYGQRLRSRRRTVAPSPHAYVDAARFGGRALGRAIGTLAAGARADFIVLDATDPALCGDIATLIDRWVIAGGRRAPCEVYVGGVRLVEAGRQRRREEIARRYRTTLATLANAAN